MFGQGKREASIDSGYGILLLRHCDCGLLLLKHTTEIPRAEQILCSNSNPHHNSNKEEDAYKSSRRKWKRTLNGAQRTNTGPNQGARRACQGGTTRRTSSRMTRESWLLKSTKRYRRTTNDRESARAGKAGGGLGTRAGSRGPRMRSSLFLKSARGDGICGPRGLRGASLTAEVSQVCGGLREGRCLAFSPNR